MTRTSLDDAQWMSLMLVMQQIPLVLRASERKSLRERLGNLAAAA